VPNGGRVYYVKRSQPPLLAPMVSDYYNLTGDKDFVARHIGTLENEYNFWLTNRTTDIETVDGRVVRLARYSAAAWQPRPEGYRQDVELLRSLGPEERVRVQGDVIAACESGWDFSTRWFRGKYLSTVSTSDIIPVDLNSFLYWNEIILSHFHGLLGECMCMYTSTGWCIHCTMGITS
jgi:alpha,alpha-trehalase